MSLRLSIRASIKHKRKRDVKTIRFDVYLSIKSILISSHDDKIHLHLVMNDVKVLMMGPRLIVESHLSNKRKHDVEQARREFVLLCF